MIKLWKVTYLPIVKSNGVIQFIYKGTESDLDKYMNDNYACKCDGCSSYISFFDSPASAEYMIEEITEDEII